MVRQSVEKLATAIGAIIAVSYLVSPGRSSSKVIEAQMSGFSAAIKAAMGTPVATDAELVAKWGAVQETDADRFMREAMETVGEFWEGFSA